MVKRNTIHMAKSFRHYRRVDPVLTELHTATRQVNSVKRNFTTVEVAEKIARAARLCMTSASDNASKDRLRKRVFGLFDYLNAVNDKAGNNPEIKRFLSDAHGVSASLQYLSMYGRPECFNSTDLRDLLFYNSLHWAGAANSLGAERPLEKGTYSFSGGSINVLEDGRMAVEGKSLGNIVRKTPHLFANELPKRIAVSSSGRTTLSPAEMFTVLRVASNAFHSTQLNLILYRMRAASEDPARMMKSKDYLSNLTNLEKIIAASLSSSLDSRAKKIAGFVASRNDASELVYHGALHPSHLSEVEQAIRSPGKMSLSAPVIAVMCHAAGLPLGETTHELSKYQVTPSMMEKAWESARKDAKVDIRLGKDQVTVTDTGLGKPFEQLSKFRFGSGTSKVLQVGTTREYTPEGTTRTVLALGQARRAAA
jgi:hypothetical protein